jgi:hypothetical protein
MTNRVKAITPKQAKALNRRDIPDVVFEAVNHLLTMNAHKALITIKTKEVIAEILQRASKFDTTLTSQMLYDRGWLDFEPIYRKAGWNVKYDGPSYGENFDGFYQFSSKRVS